MLHLPRGSGVNVIQTIWTFIHLFSQLLLETLYHIPYSKLKNTRWLPVKDISVLHLLSVCLIKTGECADRPGGSSRLQNQWPGKFPGGVPAETQQHRGDAAAGTQFYFDCHAVMYWTGYISEATCWIEFRKLWLSTVHNIKGCHFIVVRRVFDDLSKLSASLQYGTAPASWEEIPHLNSSASGSTYPWQPRY